MRSLLIGLVTLVLAVVGTLMLREDSGYVLLGYGQWTLETSLAVFLILLLLLFALFYLLVRLLAGVRGLPRRWHSWGTGRLTQRSRAALVEALWLEAIGDCPRAEQRLARSASDATEPALHYLLAARCAQHQGAGERRESYLRLATAAAGKHRLDLDLMRVDLLLDAGALAEARACLTPLQVGSGHHPQVLRRLVRVYERQGAWGDLIALLPALRRQAVYPEQERQVLERRIWAGSLQQAADGARLVDLWGDMPRALRKQPEVLEIYVRGLQKFGRGAEAAKLLSTSLGPEVWSRELVQLYGELAGSDAARQLAAAESWLPTRREDAVLLHTLGRLSARNRLWGKARSYLEASLALAPEPLVYLDLGRLQEALGQPEQAASCFRAGLALALKGATADPLVSDLPWATKLASALEAQAAGTVSLSPPVYQ